MEYIDKKIIINKNIYIICKPNNTKIGAYSFKNIKNGKFLRHYNSQVIESTSILNYQYFNDDSSFIIIPKDEDSINLQCTNKNLKNFFICLTEEKKFEISQNISPFNFNTDYKFNNIDGLINIFNERLSSIEKGFEETRKDILHSKTLEQIKSISSRIKKMNRVSFIGTGRLGENSIHTYIYMCKLIKESHVDIECLFFARNKIEKDLLDTLGLKCFIWNYNEYEHLIYLLQSQVIVFSTHTFPKNLSNAYLLAASYGSIKIQLWHGVMAKEVGCSMLKKGDSLLKTVEMLEDCTVDIVTTAISSISILDKYSKSFPGAKIICTGDARNDCILVNNKNVIIDKWCTLHLNQKKVLISPTYRESKYDSILYLEELIKFTRKVNFNKLSFALKVHPIYFSQFSNKEKEEEIKKIKKNNILYINEDEDSYLIMNKFDAMVTDYSSIRFDFLTTNKPIILFRPDESIYTKKRDINPLKEFDELDKTSYLYSDDINGNDLFTIINEDRKKAERAMCIKNFDIKTDGQSSLRTCNLIIKIINKKFTE